jgi:hypothetical protein
MRLMIGTAAAASGTITAAITAAFLRVMPRLAFLAIRPIECAAEDAVFSMLFVNFSKPEGAAARDLGLDARFPFFGFAAAVATFARAGFRIDFAIRGFFATARFAFILGPRTSEWKTGRTPEWKSLTVSTS